MYAYNQSLTYNTETNRKKTIQHIAGDTMHTSMCVPCLMKL